AGGPAGHGADHGRRPDVPDRRGVGVDPGAAAVQPGPDPGREDPMTTTTLSLEDVLTRYEPVLGLEVHVELGSRTKMFCGCPTTFGAEPNTQACPECLGLQGGLAVASRAAVEATIRIGLALNCQIATWCRFARTNYFYP